MNAEKVGTSKLQVENRHCWSEWRGIGEVGGGRETGSKFCLKLDTEVGMRGVGSSEAREVISSPNSILSKFQRN